MTDRRPSRRDLMRLMLIFLLALALRSGLAALRYSDDFKNFENGDYALYFIGGGSFHSAQELQQQRPNRGLL